MSIESAAKELTKELTREIDRLTKETERLIKLRDSVLSGSTPVNSQSISTIVKKAAAKKTPAKKAVAKKAAAPKKRTLSPAGRKAIADAAKRRWADKKKAETPAQ